MNCSVETSAQRCRDRNISLVDDLQVTLDACAEAILIVSTIDGLVEWFSGACLAIYPDLHPGMRIVELDELTEILETDGCMYSTDAPDKSNFANVIKLGEGRSAVRFNKQPQSPSHWQHYLAEQELLFSRSRTISVSEMATTLAHELNQPLGTIANILAGVQTRLRTESAVSVDIMTALSIANEQTQFAANIIGRIRDFTRARRPEYTEFDVGRLVSDSIRLFDWVFAAETVCVSFTRKPYALNVKGDYTMLQQVMTNIFRNAVDAMRQNPCARRELVVLTDVVKDGIQIKVKDNGHGMDEESERNLYTPFHTDKSSGMGVGLNICRSFVELHQGKLWITPNQQSGCTAHVLLPAYLNTEMQK